MPPQGSLSELIMLSISFKIEHFSIHYKVAENAPEVISESCGNIPPDPLAYSVCMYLYMHVQEYALHVYVYMYLYMYLFLFFFRCRRQVMTVD